ncbi:MAG: hypothetical protein ACOVLE_00115 [Pirellula staleyi]
MSSGLNDKPFSYSNAVDMSSSAISIRLREVSELHQLGLSLAKAKPMANANHAAQNKDTATSQSLLSIGGLQVEIGSDDEAMRNSRN